ncbi:hypothetical protein JCM17846_27810 [Iodidimonas nitroreducens]|uniref:Cytochrome oxidase maturation protein, cbb3-type n=1 Tax=Iodidimonas nitroreducens TaxID=1236968 RepID=A0A5A7NDE2_9PROT|nr:cbb3-type cytochrome oxidase assembly protein CcoS [Iodidimonas nitroreducens]GAK33103.1 nitrogen fixation protein FixS [alpha proteobacterium Q-1]GER05099.1 hypothetical protein JCM17846_27810 [Iodidimonas nitroreducens]
MSVLLFLIPIALFLGGLGLAAFLWSLRSGQYDDLDGAAARILLDDDGPDSDRDSDRDSARDSASDSARETDPDEAAKKPDDSPC